MEEAHDRAPAGGAHPDAAEWNQEVGSPPRDHRAKEKILEQFVIPVCHFYTRKPLKPTNLFFFFQWSLWWEPQPEGHPRGHQLFCSCWTVQEEVSAKGKRGGLGSKAAILLASAAPSAPTCSLLCVAVLSGNLRRAIPDKNRGVLQTGSLESASRIQRLTVHGEGRTVTLASSAGEFEYSRASCDRVFTPGRSLSLLKPKYNASLLVWCRFCSHCSFCKNQQTYMCASIFW